MTAKLRDFPPPSAENRRNGAANRVGKNREKGVGHPATAICYYSDEETEFLLAIEAYKGETGKKFPTWTEALRVLRSLGWKRTPEGEEKA